MLVSFQDRESQIAAIESTFDAAQRPVSSTKGHVEIIIESKSQ